MTFWDIPLFLMLGPTQYLADRFEFDDEYRIPLLVKLLYIPAAVVFIIRAVLQLHYPDVILHSVEAFFKWDTGNPFIMLYLISTFHMEAFYALNIVKRYDEWKQIGVTRVMVLYEVFTYSMLFLIYSFMEIGWFYGYFLNGLFLGNSLGAFLFLLAIAAYVGEYDHYLKKLKRKKILKEKMKKAGSDMESQLKKLLEEDKIFLLEDLKLSMVSSFLEVSEEVFSSFIQQKYRLNFRNYINRYRIGEAIEIFQNRESTDILKTALDVGFSSYSTFHRSFKKETGTTPAEYLKKITQDR